MCQKAAETAANLLEAVEPDLKALLTAANLIDTPAGVTVIAEYNAAESALATWTSGTPAQEVIEVLNDFQEGFEALPLPPTVEVWENLIEAAVVTVVGILTANSPAPPTTEVAPTAEVAAQAQTFHAHAVGADTEAKVVTLTGIKVSGFDKARAALGDTHVVANRWKSEWAKAGAIPVTPKTT